MTEHFSVCVQFCCIFVNYFWSHFDVRPLIVVIIKLILLKFNINVAIWRYRHQVTAHIYNGYELLPPVFHF